MTTGGEGGMVTTDDRELWSRMWSFKDHGKNWEAVYERQHAPGFRWLHESFGTNWRMIEMQAVIGRIQLQRMAEWTAARTANATSICSALAPFAGKNGPLRVPELSNAQAATGSRHAFYKFYAYVRPGNLAEGWSRDRVIEEIMARGVPCYQGSCSEVYLEKAFDGTNWRPAERLRIARELGETSIMFLVHPTLAANEIATMKHAVADVANSASRCFTPVS